MKEKPKLTYVERKNKNEVNLESSRKKDRSGDDLGEKMLK